MLRIFSQTLAAKRISEHYFSTSIRYNEAAQTNGDVSYQIRRCVSVRRVRLPRRDTDEY